MHVSVTEVLDLLQGLANDKATGMDGLSGESLKFADPILALLLSICFTCMFKHSYLPVSMLDSVVVPLVKNKNGDLSVYRHLPPDVCPPPDICPLDICPPNICPPPEKNNKQRLRFNNITSIIIKSKYKDVKDEM